jgi:hypothetical protein
MHLFHLQGKNICERGTNRLSLQPPAHVGSSIADIFTLKMKAIRSSETSVHTRSTRLHIPEDGIPQSHRRENLKSYFMKKAYTSLEDHFEICIFIGVECYDVTMLLLVCRTSSSSSNNNSLTT